MEIIYNTFRLSDGTIIGCYFYDTNGTQRFRAVNESYYKKADGCIVIYDITSQNSFDEIEKYYIPNIKEKCKENIPTLILGNKIDMSDMRKVSVEKGKQLALKYCFLFNETSSIENTNLYDIFQIIIEITNEKTQKIEHQVNINNQVQRKICFKYC